MTMNLLCWEGGTDGRTDGRTEGGREGGRREEGGGRREGGREMTIIHIDGLGHKPFKSGQAFFQNDDKNDKTHRAQNVYLSRPT